MFHILSGREWKRNEKVWGLIENSSKTFDIDPISMRPDGVCLKIKFGCLVLPIDREASKFSSRVVFALALKSGNAEDKSGSDCENAIISENVKRAER